MLEERECGDKIQFLHRFTASASMQNGIQDGILKGFARDWNVYQCSFCWYYHIGHIPIGSKRSWV